MLMERRRLMKAIFGLGALLLPARTFARPSVFPQPPSPPDGHRTAALARLGKACLEAHPWLGGSDLFQSLQAAQSALPVRTADDFRENRTLLVDGWLLAESEAVFYVQAYRALTA